MLTPPTARRARSRLLLLVVHEVGVARLAAVIPVIVLRHEAALARRRRVLAQAHDLAAVLDAVVLQHAQRVLLALVLHLLRLGVRLLLALLAAAAEAQHEVERRLLLDVVVRERAAVLELLAREDEALLVRRDALLVLDL